MSGPSSGFSGSGVQFSQISVISLLMASISASVTSSEYIPPLADWNMTLRSSGNEIRMGRPSTSRYSTGMPASLAQLYMDSAMASRSSPAGAVDWPASPTLGRPESSPAHPAKPATRTKAAAAQPSRRDVVVGLLMELFIGGFSFLSGGFAPR